MFLELQKDMVIWLQGFHNAFTDFFFNVISFFGEPEFYILLLGLFYWVINKKAGEFIGITLGISLGLNNLFKAFFNIPRPFQTYPEIQNFREYTATGSSFPSGHVQGSATVFYALAAFYKKRWLWILAAVMLVLMMLSRLFLGVHYLQDVIAGGIIGIAIAVGLYKVYDKLHEDEQLLHRFYLVILLGLLPFIFIVNVNDFFRGYGIYAGIVLAVIYEKRYVNFTYDISLIKKVLRYVLGVVIMLIMMIGVGTLFSQFGFEDESFFANFFDFIRFFLIAFVGIGLYPKFFTIFKF